MNRRGFDLSAGDTKALEHAQTGLAAHAHELSRRERELESRESLLFKMEADLTDERLRPPRRPRSGSPTSRSASRRSMRPRRPSRARKPSSPHAAPISRTARLRWPDSSARASSKAAGPRSRAVPSSPSSTNGSADSSARPAMRRRARRSARPSAASSRRAYVDVRRTLSWLYTDPLGALAQLGERRLCKPEVTGSIPARSTEKGPGNGAFSFSSRTPHTTQIGLWSTGWSTLAGYSSPASRERAHTRRQPGFAHGGASDAALLGQGERRKE